MADISAAPAASAPISDTTPSASNDQANNTSSEAIAAPMTPAAVKKFKQLNLKVDGKEISESLPFEFDDTPEMREYLSHNLQKSKAFEKRAQDSAQLEREVRTFVEELKKNPRKVLSDPNIGVDLKKLAAEMIEEEIANSQKSPHQLEKEKLEKELKAMKDEREKEKESNRQRELQALQQVEYERYDQLMSKALEKSDLPKSPYIVKKMADYMLMGLQNGVKVDPEDVLPLVREEMTSDLKEMFSVMPEEVVEAIVGKDVLNKIRKKNLQRAKSAPPKPIGSSVTDAGGKKVESAKPVDKQNFKSFFGV